MSRSSPENSGAAAVGAKGQLWSDQEVELIVAEYFQMLALQLAGAPFNKAERNRAMQKLLPRNDSAIHRKHSNISAVLEKLGLPTVRGYKGLPHFQRVLVAQVDQHLATEGAPLFAYATATPKEPAQPTSLIIVAPPVPARKQPKETPTLRRLIRKFDPAERDARNRELGKQGEELVYHRERLRLAEAGRNDLAQRVEWTSHERGDGAGYDVASFEPDGRERLIEVKTTNGGALTPFFLSENERAFSEERPDAFRLLRLYNFIAGPTAFELPAPLQERLSLRPTSYCATVSR